jgi:hypothetical protein
MPGSVIVSTARTPIGKLSGALASFSAMDLGGIAIKGALERAGVGPEQVDYVIMGHVLQAGQGQITARQAAEKAGIPMSVPAITINKVCLSGINALYLADQMIASTERPRGGLPSCRGYWQEWRGLAGEYGPERARSDNRRSNSGNGTRRYRIWFPLVGPSPR